MVPQILITEAPQAAVSLYQIESENLIASFRITCAMLVGDDSGNPDIGTAMREIKACNARIHEGFASGVITYESGKTPTLKTKVEHNSLERFKEDTMNECRLSLSRQKLRYLTKLNGQAYTEKGVAMARLGVREKRVHVEKDTITRDKLLTADSPCLSIIAATVIKTINFPKGYVKQGETPAEHGDFLLPDKNASKAQRSASLAGKARRKLSPLEECEMFQTAALVLIGNHALHLEIDGSDLWRGEKGLWSQIYCACRDTLGIDRMGSSEVHLPGDDPLFILSEAIASGYDAGTVARARVQLVKHVREWRKAIDVDRDNSTNPKRKSNAKIAKQTLRKIVSGFFIFSGMTQAELESTSKAKAKLVESVSKGKRILANKALELDMAAAMSCLA